MQITPDEITRLRLNEIVVFGSNLAGTHRTGFALKMKRDYGAADGITEGLSGCCYALPVKDEHLHWLPLNLIDEAVGRFYSHARQHPFWHFSVTKIGGFTPGYQPHDLAMAFFRHGRIPSNVSLPRAYWDILKVKVHPVVFILPGQPEPAKLSV